MRHVLAGSSWLRMLVSRPLRWRNIAIAAALVYVAGPAADIEWREAMSARCPEGASLGYAVEPTSALRARYGSDLPSPTPKLGCLAPGTPLPSQSPVGFLGRAGPDTMVCPTGYAPSGGSASCASRVSPPPRFVRELPSSAAVHRLSLYLNGLRLHLLTLGDELEGFRIDW